MEDSKLLAYLERIGFNGKSALVYSYLLRCGGAYPPNISSATKLNRSTVYKILLDLSEKGLVAETEKSKKLYYKAENLEKILDFAKDKVRIAEDELEKTEKMMPKLFMLFSGNEKPKIRSFEGAGAMLDILDDMVSSGKYESLSFSSATIGRNSVAKKDIKRFAKDRERIGISSRVLMADTEENRRYASELSSYNRISYRPSIKFMPQDTAFPDAELHIYGNNKVAMIRLAPNGVTGTIMEDQAVYNLMKMIFETVWSKI